MQTKGKYLLAAALTVLIVLSAFIVVWQFQAKANSATDRDVLFQVAAFNTFSLGNYAGFISYGELAKHGDFGIGTFDGLNGEMLALNGVFYQIPSDGIPRQVNSSVTAPYATITYFHSDQTLTVTDSNYTQLKAQIDEALPSQDAIYAIKVSGTYDYAQTRAPAKQTQPYPVLADALKTQSVFTLSNVSATAVGFWFPNSMNGVDFAGYHLHLITDDHAAGGHMLDCIIRNATVEIDQINQYNLVLP
jgi:acetolactate decarboxylase